MAAQRVASGSSTQSRNLALIAILAVLALASTAPAQRELVVAVRQLPITLEIAQARTASELSLSYTPFNQLVEIDYRDNNRLIPGIATDWRQIDAVTWEFDIRTGVKFHDGTELTVDDVVFSYERYLVDNGQGWYQMGAFARNWIASVAATVDGKFRITLKEPDRYFVGRIPTHRIFSIVPAPPLVGTWNYNFRTPIGTGPYRVAEFVRDDYIRFEAHADYWGGTPPADVVLVRRVPELSDRLAGLASGEYHLIDSVAPDAMATVNAMPNASVSIAPQDSIRMIVFKLDHPIVSDARVRRAIGLAIDRDSIIDALWNGQNVVTRGHQLPLYGDMYLEDWPFPRYDPEEARRLLAEAGYAGQELLLPIGNDIYVNEVATSELMLEMWRAVGLNVRIEIKESLALVGETEGKAFQHTSNGIFGHDPVFGLWSNWRSGGAMTAVVDPFWINEEFEALGHVLEASTDLEERRATFRRMMEIWEYEDPPGVLLHTRALIFGTSNAIDWRGYGSPRLDFGPRNLAFR